MKKVLLSGVLGIISTTLFAQLPVSTTAENKNVVLEEFTGIYCTFCPDGHRLAQELKTAYPNDVFLVNVHVGGFAAPNGSDPDFRTSFGTALANQSQLAGYPAGTVNRRSFAGFEQNGSPAGATAMSRGDWDDIAEDSVLIESSYVNVALEGDIEVATRTLTVDLEAYFTSNGPGSVNVNVAVLQNNVEGPQTGAANFYPQNILPNGNYNHQHMLRHFMTGQWGVVINTTTMGSTFSDQYTWVIPQDINGVPVELGDLEIVAYIAEGQQNIVTGNSGPINFTLPAGSVLVDAGAADNTTIPDGFCDDMITPSVIVTNTSNETISEYDVSYQLDGGTPVVESITTPLMAGSSATHNFPTISTGTGSHLVSYSVSVTSSTEVELVTGNNTASSNGFTIVTNAGMAPYAQSFEGATPFSLPGNVYEVNPDGIDMFVIDSTIVNGVTNRLGGFGNSESSVFWDFFTASTVGTEAAFMLETVDLTGFDTATLTFSHSHAQWQNQAGAAVSNDRLEVQISEDCGVTWTNVFDQAGPNLSTAGASANRFFPSSQDWVANTVDLTSYVGSTVLIAFNGTSDYGNSLYVDDINLSADTLASPGDTTGGGGGPGDTTGGPGDTTSIGNMLDYINNVTVYPNPASEFAIVEFEVSQSKTVAVTVFDVVGKVVDQVSPTVLNAGTDQIRLNTSSFDGGIYFIRIESDGEAITEMLTVSK